MKSLPLIVYDIYILFRVEKRSKSPFGSWSRKARPKSDEQTHLPSFIGKYIPPVPVNERLPNSSNPPLSCVHKRGGVATSADKVFKGSES